CPRPLFITGQQLATIDLAACIVNRVKVAIEATHSYVPDLEISVAHGPTTVGLYVNENCFKPGNNIDNTWSDLAADAPDPCTPMPGTALRPHDPLVGFANFDLVGEWTLRIEDTLQGDSGTLKGAAFAFDVSC